MKKRLLIFLVLGILIPAHESLASSLKQKIEEHIRSGKMKILVEYYSGAHFVDFKKNEQVLLGGSTGVDCSLFPDGKSIVYVINGLSIKTDTLKVFTVSNGNSSDLATFAEIYGFAVDPSGQNIAFAANEEKEGAGDFHREAMNEKEAALYLQKEQKLSSKHRSLYVIDIATRHAEKVVSENVYKVDDTAWSPDGQKVIYESGDGDKYIYDKNSKTSIKILDRDYWQMSWTPDSKRVVFRGYGIGNKPDYYSIALDGSDKKLFMENRELRWFPYIGEIITSIHFSPDGRYILYGRNSDVFRDDYIYVMDLQTKEKVQIGDGVIAGWAFNAALDSTQRPN